MKEKKINKNLTKPSKTKKIIKQLKDDIIKKITSKEFNETLLKTIPFGMDIVDEKGNILYINKNLQSIVGRNVIGKKCWMVYNDNKKQCKQCPLKKKVKSDKTERILADHVLGGKTFIISHTDMLYQNKKVILEIFQDITLRTKFEKEREETLYHLGERVKELNCLYRLSKLVEKPGIPLNKILRGTVNLFPPAWQYPEITCARIVVNNEEYKTKNFKKTKALQSAKIKVFNKETGVIEICYLEEKPDMDEGPFLKEERHLINIIAERLGRIIERYQTGQALQEGEKRFRELFNNVNDAIFLHNLNKDGTPGRFIEVNDIACKRLGYTREELLKMSPKDIDAEQTKKDFPVNVRKLLLKGNLTVEAAHITKKGKEIPVEINAHLFTLKNKERILSVARDISERKKAESEINNLAKFPSENPNPVLRITRNGQVIYSNDAGLVLLDSWKCRVGKILPANLCKFIIEVFKSNSTKNMEVNINKRIISLIFTPVIDTDYINLYGRDITKRRKAEEERVKSQKFNNLLLDSIPHPAMLIKTDRTVIAANNIAKEIGAIIGKPCWQEFAHSKYIKDGEDKCWYCLADGTMEEMKPKNCEVEAFDRMWDTWWVPIEEDIYLHYAIDITERKIAEEKIKQSEEKLRLTFESISDGIIVTDLKNNIIQLNNQILKLSGYSNKEELLDEKAYNFISEKDRYKIMKGLVNTLKYGYSSILKCKIIKKDGKESDAELKIELLKDINEKPNL